VTLDSGKLLYTASTTATRNFTMTNGRLQAASGANITLSGSQIHGGFIAGPGNFITTNTNFTGTTTFAGASLQPTGPTTLLSFSNGGAIASSAAVSWDGGINLSSGVITLNSAAL